MVALTRQHISEGAAKFWILGAAAMSFVSGIVTSFLAVRGALGFSLWNLADAGASFALAVGVAMRSLAAAWLLLTYYLLGRVLLYVEAGRLPTVRVVTFVLFYAMAIVCIGLYPRSRGPTLAAREQAGDEVRNQRERAG